MSVRQLRDWHRPRLEVLAGSGADLLACETIPCLAEVEARVGLFEEFPSVPGWISCSCRDNRNLCHGETLAEAVALASACPNVVAVGVNCTAPRWIEGVLSSVRDRTHLPLLAYPNSGEVWDANGRCWQPQQQSLDWGAASLRWRKAGARLIGGCCRTTPDTIRAIRACFSLEASTAGRTGKSS